MKKVTLIITIVVIFLFLISGCSESRVRVSYHSICCHNCGIFHHSSSLVHCYTSIPRYRPSHVSFNRRSSIIHNNYPIIHNRPPARNVVPPVERRREPMNIHNNRTSVRKESNISRKSSINRNSSVRRIPTNGRRK